MCGINGIALSSRSSRTLDKELLVRMRDCLVHRGPDDGGVFLDRNVGLGHRRLSIVDLAGGHQPMSNEDGTLHITYNGEIYNYSDFRVQLEAAGHVYQTRCDTETILHLYEEHGERCVESLRGMFAFAIWDQTKRELFLARDRLGVKPLYYALTADGSLYFASEIKSLLVAGAVTPVLNYGSLPDYLANHATSGEETLFVGVKRLLPGHTLLWRDGQIAVKKYWDITFCNSGNTNRSDKDYIAEWLDLFRTSVRLRLMADVPLGMFLSGGIDSSAIAALMSTMVDQPIKTFSVAFAEREANELEYARLVAKKFHTDHHETVVSAEEFFNALPQLIWHEDEPLAHPASVPLYFVSLLAARHVKVVLTGEGSDEMLAGYYRYRTTIYNLSLGNRYERMTTPSLRGVVRRGIENIPLSGGVKRKLGRTFLCLPSNLESLYFDNFSVFRRDMQLRLLSDTTRDLTGPLDPYSQMRSLSADSDADSLLNQLLYVDTKTYLHELLMKQDQMSMAASIESRVPFLDHKLVEFTASLPVRLKLRGITTKYILRESMKGILPEAILTRSKMGFPVPLGAWFRGPFRDLLDEYLLGERTRARGIFNHAYLRQLVDEHQGGVNHSERLWMLVNFEMWQRQFFDGEGFQKPIQLERTGGNGQMVTIPKQLEKSHVNHSPLLRGRDLVCFSHDWSGDPLSKTHLMRILAHDNRVLWVNSIGYRTPTASKADITRAFRKLRAATSPLSEPERNIFVLNPIAVPVYGRQWIRRFNRKLLQFQVRRAMRQLGLQRPVNFVFNPAAAVVAGSLGEEQILYYCVDEYTEFSGVSSTSLAEMEQQLLRRADLVIVSAERLYQSKVKTNPRTVLIRHGVDFDHFRKALDPETLVSEEIQNLPRPIIGFFGLIADWVDLELMASVAKKFSGGSMVLLGKATTDTSVLEQLPNVHMLGRKSYASLPAYCKGFDVALLPFRINELTLNANPLKVREYLAAGLPVVSTAIPEVEVLGLCRIGHDTESFIREVQLALQDPGPSVARSERIRGESWESRVDELRECLAELQN
jgi:asparagine synthase (glutamine-hydrolysing)